MSVQKGISLSYKLLSPPYSLKSEIPASPQQFLFTALSSEVWHVSQVWCIDFFELMIYFPAVAWLNSHVSSGELNCSKDFYNRSNRRRDLKGFSFSMSFTKNTKELGNPIWKNKTQIEYTLLEPRHGFPKRPQIKQELPSGFSKGNEEDNDLMTQRQPFHSRIQQRFRMLHL